MKSEFHLKKIEESLQQALDHAQGKITLKTTIMKLPQPAPEIKPKEIIKIRKRRKAKKI